MLPSLQSRLEVRSSLVAALDGTADPIQEINRVLWRNWSVNEGANVASLNSTYRGELSPEIRDRLHPDRWYVESSNAEGIERLLRLARERKVRVFWLLPPISRGLQEWRERSGSEAKFEEFVRSYQARYPQVVTVLDARRVVTDPSLIRRRHAHVRTRCDRAQPGRRRSAEGRAGERRGTMPEVGSSWSRRRISPAMPSPPLEDVDRSKQIVRGE